MADDSLQPVRVWDLPTRVFHWSLAACVVALVVTGKIGGAAMPWHARAGYAAGTLLLFRLAWGVVGGHWSRFAAFSYSPRSIVAYLRGEVRPGWTTGHTPLGAVSVYALLGFLVAQVGTGLFGDDQADFTGPLNILVSNSTARLLTGYHKEIGQLVLIGLVLLHVGAIGYYQLRRREDLLGPMVHGDKRLSGDVPASRDDTASRVLALVLLGLSAGAMAWLVRLGGE